MKVLEIQEALRNGGIENAAQEAKWIAEYAVGRYNGSERAAPQLDEIVCRRINGEPLQYLLGEWEFYGYPFKVGKGVLIPRPETELLVDVARDALFGSALFGLGAPSTLVLDLCAGTGCVGISLAKKTGCNVIAVEKSPSAIKYLKKNIKLNKVENQVKIIKGNVLEIKLLLYKADCILINPPYLSGKEMLSLQKEVTYEPKMALYGGKDGLDFYRKFFASWREAIAQTRLFACEVGDGQAEEVCRLMEGIGVIPAVKEDFNGIDRIVFKNLMTR
jgi:release factor glutamine methyltransferase